MSADRRLAGLHILVVEDEFLIAMELEDAIAQMGATVTMVGGRTEALDALAHERPDGAILDVQLGEEMSYDVAKQLIGLKIPFILATGFEGTILPPHMRDRPRLSKPFAPADLERLAVQVFRARR